VQYGRLADIGRRVVETQVSRPVRQRLLRTLLKETLPRKWLFAPAMKTGQMVRPLLPRALQDKVPAPQSAGTWPRTQHAHKMLFLEGCVQPSMSPNINTATARVFDAVGVQLVAARRAGCCGAIRWHMNDADGGRADMRRNIDAWWPYLEQGIDTILINASGCGAMIKEYGHALADDPAYADKAARVSAAAKDVSEVLPRFEERMRDRLDARKERNQRGQRVAYHPPCTLQHGQQIRGKVEGLLRAAGVDVVLCADSHLCCGSAGTYSVLHPEIAHELRDRKLSNLEATGATEIVSANIGCLTHLQSGTDTPVTHWIELVDRALAQ
jgi:glycolate oxidase iron-sulfur subunit